MESTNKHFKRYTVTTALPYANGPVHIGHLAGVYIPADTYVRYLRMRGEEVLFVGGSDEHGVPITQQQGTFGAGGEGTPPSCLSPPPKCPPKPSQRGVGLGSPSCNFSQHTASSSFMGGGARCGVHVRQLDALFDWESVSWHLPG